MRYLVQYGNPSVFNVKLPYLRSGRIFYLSEIEESSSGLNYTEEKDLYFGDLKVVNIN